MKQAMPENSIKANKSTIVIYTWLRFYKFLIL
jgi:hypothetical protein